MQTYLNYPSVSNTELLIVFQDGELDQVLAYIRLIDNYVDVTEKFKELPSYLTYFKRLHNEEQSKKTTHAL